MRPGWLVNPLTLERLELDRYDSAHKVAFEFQGPQHFRTTEKFPSENKVAWPNVRDAIKFKLCVEREITLVAVTREDLTLTTMQAKVGELLPRTDLSQREHLVRATEKAARAYRA